MVINYADFKVRAVEERELKEKKEEEKKDRWHQKAFLEELNLHHFRQAFLYGKGVRYHQKNFKIETLQDFEKTYILYVAMAEKPLSSGQKWFLR